MKKEFEALEKEIEWLKEGMRFRKELKFDDELQPHLAKAVEEEYKHYENIIQALAELKQINEAVKPSEAMESLDRILHCNDDDYTLGYYNHDIKLVKQALLKAQEMESKLQRWYDLLSMDGINSKQKVKEEIYNLLNILNNNSK